MAWGMVQMVWAGKLRVIDPILTYLQYIGVSLVWARYMANVSQLHARSYRPQMRQWQ